MNEYKNKKFSRSCCRFRASCTIGNIIHRPLGLPTLRSKRILIKQKPCLFPETITFIDSEKAGLLTRPGHCTFPAGRSRATYASGCCNDFFKGDIHERVLSRILTPFPLKPAEATPGAFSFSLFRLFGERKTFSATKLRVEPREDQTKQLPLMIFNR